MDPSTEGLADLLSAVSFAPIAAPVPDLNENAMKTGFLKKHPIDEFIKNVCHGQTNLLIIQSVLFVA